MLIKSIRISNIVYHSYVEDNSSCSELVTRSIINTSKVVNLILKSGFKKRSLQFIWEHLGWFLHYSKIFKRSLQGILPCSTRLNSILLESYLGLFSLNGVNLITRNVRLSRKIRKYTKNKVRYRSYSYILRDRQVTGYSFRMWKFILLIDQDNISNRSHNVLSLLWDNYDTIYINSNYEKYDNLQESGIVANRITPQSIQFKMLENLVKRRRT